MDTSHRGLGKSPTGFPQRSGGHCPSTDGPRRPALCSSVHGRRRCCAGRRYRCAIADAHLVRRRARNSYRRRHGIRGGRRHEARWSSSAPPVVRRASTETDPLRVPASCYQRVRFAQAHCVLGRDGRGALAEIRPRRCRDAAYGDRGDRRCRVPAHRHAFDLFGPLNGPGKMAYGAPAACLTGHLVYAYPGDCGRSRAGG